MSELNCCSKVMSASAVMAGTFKESPRTSHDCGIVAAEEGEWQVQSNRARKISKSPPSVRNTSRAPLKDRGRQSRHSVDTSALRDSNHSRDFEIKKSSVQLTYEGVHKSTSNILYSSNDKVWPKVDAGQRMCILNCKEKRSTDSQLHSLPPWRNISERKSAEILHQLPSISQEETNSKCRIKPSECLTQITVMSEQLCSLQIDNESPTSTLHKRDNSKNCDDMPFSGEASDKAVEIKELPTLHLGKCKKRNTKALRGPPSKLSPQDYRVCIIDSNQKMKYEQSEHTKQPACHRVPPSLEQDFPDLPSALKILSKYVVKTDVEDESLSNSACSLRIKNTESTGKNRKKQPKTKDPISLNIVDIIKEPTEICTKASRSSVRRKIDEKRKLGGNFLDSSNPIRQRGKHRENPRKKRHSTLKNIILNERRKKKELTDFLEKILNPGCNVLERECEEQVSSESICDDFSTVNSVKAICEEDSRQQLLIDEVKEKEKSCVVEDLTKCISSSSATDVNDKDNVCVESSPSSSCSHVTEMDNSYTCKATFSMSINDCQKTKINMTFHSRKFRDYCDNIRSKELDQAATAFLKEIYRFQDRQYQKDPIRAHAKRRFVLGFREVNKFLMLKKLKAIVIAPDLEPVKAPGGLDETVISIRNEGKSQQIPVIFAVGRRQLGSVFMKKVPISIIGIMNPEGAEELYRCLLDEWKAASHQYQEKVSELLKSSALLA